ncbi:MAG: hypothetical protein P8J68_01245 [Arenicellaceae bacterium]|nr:hypothetical protein [Arenicellaceae bacterium]
MRQLPIILLTAFLYACGGGDSTSGGGSESASSSSETTTLASSGSAATATLATITSTPATITSTPATPATPSSSNLSPAEPSSLIGTYVGNASGTISVGGGLITEPFAESFTVVIDENNLATVTVDGNSETSAISNGTVNANVPFDEVDGDLRCVGTLQLFLSVGASAISGTITGSGTCNQSGLQADFIIENGIIAATLQ